jgi:MFS transporter, DHA2 family, multidrug resistance protein
MAATVAAPSRGGIALAVLSDLFLGRTDNIDIRFAAAIALLFNVLMVVVAIIAIALTVPRDDPGVGR